MAKTKKNEKKLEKAPKAKRTYKRITLEKLQAAAQALAASGGKLTITGVAKQAKLNPLSVGAWMRRAKVTPEKLAGGAPVAAPKEKLAKANGKMPNVGEFTFGAAVMASCASAASGGSGTVMISGGQFTFEDSQHKITVSAKE